MCGILAIAGEVEENTITQCADILEIQHNRGPDNSNLKIFERCILGHNRLSIIDFSDRSNQPMRDSKEKIWISFNGEIFNFLELKNKLESKGHIFKTTSDTEVLIKTYIEFGEEFIKEIEGQFSFVIYDEEKNKIVAARDRAGINPFYYTIHNNKIYIASMFKSLVKIKGFEIDQDSLDEYLLLRYVLPPKSLAKEIYQLSPGEMLIIPQINSKIKMEDVILKKYWEIKLGDKEENFDANKIELKNKIKTATIKRLISDAPIGLFLSGGLDSTIVCSIMSKKITNFKTFSIRFGEHSEEENQYSKKVSQEYQTKHTIINVEQKK